MTLRLLPVALSLLLLAGCGAAPQSITPTRGAMAAAGDRAAATEAEFVEAVSKLGVKLGKEELTVIAAERVVVPSGKMAPRPAADLSAEKNLQVHYEKHRHEFKPFITSAEAYLAQGVAAGKGERGKLRYFFDTQSFKKKYQTHVVRWNPGNKDFTAFRTDGAMTTYYRNFKVSPKRFVEVPTF